MKPIIFSTPMVQAILDGRKTQTRRIVKGTALLWLDDFTPDFVMSPDNNLCPYGKPGDILWVRESFTIIGNDIVRDDYTGELLDEKPQYVFRGQKQPHIEKLYKWNPSIHMPFSACRIFIEIVSVKVERLQDISETDAVAEGIERDTNGYCRNYLSPYWSTPGETAIDSFQSLWTKINGPDSWSSNPWVWVIEFKHSNKQIK